MAIIAMAIAVGFRVTQYPEKLFWQNDLSKNKLPGLNSEGDLTCVCVECGQCRGVSHGAW